MKGIWLMPQLVLWALVVVFAVVVVSLLRNVGLLATAVQQLQTGVEDALTLEVGAPVHELPLTTLSGQATSLAAQHGAPAVLVFVSPGCGPCHDLLLAIHQGTPALLDLPPTMHLVLVSLDYIAAT